MKTISFRAASKFLVSTAMVFGLVVLAGFAGVGIAAFFAFHELGENFSLSRPTRADLRAEQAATPRLVALSRMEMWQGQTIAMDVNASLAANRFVAAGSSDQAHFTYADYEQGEPTTARKTVSPVTTVIPPPLDPVASAPVAQTDDDAPVHLSDPGSRYIMDERTGRIIGIDGSVGARAEAQQQRQQATLADAANVRPREVRAALSVDAEPISDLPPPKPDMYPAIRHAMPVDDSDADADAQAVTPPQAFNAAAEVADDARPVRRAEAVMIVPRVRAQRTGLSLP